MYRVSRGKFIIAAFLVFVGWSVSIRAQIGPPVSPAASGGVSAGSIRGRVVLTNGAPVSQAVKVTLLNLRGSRDMVFTDNQGQFEFRGLNPGEYTLEIEGD